MRNLPIGEDRKREAKGDKRPSAREAPTGLTPLRVERLELSGALSIWMLRPERAAKVLDG